MVRLARFSEAHSRPHPRANRSLHNPTLFLGSLTVFTTVLLARHKDSNPDLD